MDDQDRNTETMAELLLATPLLFAEKDDTGLWKKTSSTSLENAFVILAGQASAAPYAQIRPSSHKIIQKWLKNPEKIENHLPNSKAAEHLSLEESDFQHRIDEILHGNGLHTHIKSSRQQINNALSVLQALRKGDNLEPDDIEKLTPLLQILGDIKEFPVHAIRTNILTMPLEQDIEVKEVTTESRNKSIGNTPHEVWPASMLTVSPSTVKRHEAIKDTFKNIPTTEADEDKKAFAAITALATTLLDKCHVTPAPVVSEASSSPHR